MVMPSFHHPSSCKIVILYHCFRINVHKIMHVKLNPMVMIKPLHLSIYFSFIFIVLY